MLFLSITLTVVSYAQEAEKSLIEKYCNLLANDLIERTDGYLQNDTLVTENGSILCPPQGGGEQTVHLCSMLLPELHWEVSDRSLFFYFLAKPAPVVTVKVYLLLP